MSVSWNICVYISKSERIFVSSVVIIDFRLITKTQLITIQMNILVIYNVGFKITEKWKVHRLPYNGSMQLMATTYMDNLHNGCHYWSRNFIGHSIYSFWLPRRHHKTLIIQIFCFWKCQSNINTITPVVCSLIFNMHIIYLLL